jgi:hypothetical protein
LPRGLARSLDGAVSGALGSGIRAIQATEGAISSQHSGSSAVFALIGAAIILLAIVASLMAGRDYENTPAVREAAEWLGLPPARPASWLAGAPDELVEQLYAGWATFRTDEYEQLLASVPDSHGAAIITPAPLAVAWASPPMRPDYATLFPASTGA